MIVLLFVVAAVVISHTEAANCQEDQHCSECDWETGHCQTKCHDGYYDLRCSSKCSSQCKNNVCEKTGTGIDRCTEGCKQGFQGSNCKIPCLDPGDTCEQCPRACDGEFCNLGSSCIAGCNNSYYGSHCSICSRRCKSCNVKTRTCEECHAGHGGVNCLGGCEDDDCTLGCKPGFYGPLCVHMCSLHCRPDTNSNVGDSSLSATTAVSSKPECEQLTGDCVHGCERGWYGSHCSSKCKSLCRNLNCDNTGACIDGCIPGTYGTDCLPCPENCVNSTCHTQDGSCLGGCVNGFYGSFCTNTCESCLDGICNQTTGKCNTGCGNNCSSHDCMARVNCDPSILQRDTMPGYKPKETTPIHVSPSDEADGRTSYVVMSTAALVVAVSVAVVSVVRKICRRRSNNIRVQGDHDVSPRRVHTSSVTYETLHRYSGN
ncbi:multiple epidermal growth factor-like domains protein 11 [Haliotis rubra]|uniref:multiple epidermal growth factor-like domains protein 11 n=1 Tax=Haliotis rubra TaxID=36100 RepID=UPI001EE5B06C|nr:multiple epidermal growth factor-like domains protein 11 [Haliotis rubra]